MPLRDAGCKNRRLNGAAPFRDPNESYSFATALCDHAPMGILTVLLGVLAAAMAVLLGLALGQNLGVLRDLRRADRPLPRLLRDALVVWSPLALVIVLVAFAASGLASLATALTYRLTTVDEYCEVPAVSANTLMPCSEMDGVLPTTSLRRAGSQAELEAHLAERFRRARQRLLGASAGEVSRRAAEPGVLLAELSPRGVLG